MMKNNKKRNLYKYLKKNRDFLNEVSILINILFLSLLLWEFFIPGTAWMQQIQILFWIFFIIELFFRIKIHKFKKNYIFNIYTLIDFVTIGLIFLRFWVVDHTILHLFTALKILRTYRVITDLWRNHYFFAKNKDIFFSVVNLVIFMFFMSSLVFLAQVDINDKINNFSDALYFTLSTLTTTGFWDIVVVGKAGQWLAIMIMTLWVWLFLRLLSVIFRPIKQHVMCKHCGLKKHDKDASHCKHCGNIIFNEHLWENIE